MALTLSKVLKIVPTAGETTQLARTFTDPNVLDSTILVYYNGAAINSYVNTVDQSLINEKFYALYSITSASISMFIIAKQGFRHKTYNPSSPLINMQLAPTDQITVTYQFTR